MKTKKEKKDWFDEHVVVMGSNKKVNEIIKQKIKDDLKKSISKEEVLNEK